MGSELGAYAPHVAMLLLGGLATSLGAVRLARGARGRAILGRMRTWAVALAGLAAMGVGASALLWMTRRVLAAGATGAGFPSPLALLLFGIGVGVPLSLPGLLLTWSEERPERAAERNRRIASATRDDRRAFAERLAGQIREASDRPRDLTVRAGGDGGRVLEFRGDLAREEGERLVAALRAEMCELGFRRAEGGKREDGGAGWWTRV